MPGPGKGRYTEYVANASTKNTLLSKLFNERAANGAGVFYGAPNQTNNSKAAEELLKRAVPLFSEGKGDATIFPSGVNMGYQGTSAATAPNFNDVAWKNPGDPAFAYVPDISSPGPGRTSPLEKDVDPKITQSDVKPNYVAGAPDTGTTSPADTSPSLGVTSLGKDLNLGKSSV